MVSCGSIWLAFLCALVLCLSTVDGFIGGKNATKGDISQIVSLRNVLRDNQLFGLGHHCGGAVLTEQVILTSASCLGDSNGNRFMLPGFIRIVGGTLNKDLMEEYTFDSSLVSIRPHPGFNFRSHAYNLAVVKMGRAIPPKTYNLKIIKLASEVPGAGTNCTITGWGKTTGPKDPVYPYAQTGAVSILAMDHCEKFYKAIPDNMLCFGRNEVAVCMEDMGTVVFCNGEAVGVIALVDTCQKVPHMTPFVATNLIHFREWILENGAGRDGLAVALWVACVVVLRLGW